MLPPWALYRAMAWKMRLIGEAEVRILSSLVPVNKVALDVGANYGSYTYWLSRLAHNVIAFEPLPHLSAHLRRVVASNVHVMPYALSNISGEADCSVPVENGFAIEGQASLREMPGGGSQVFRVQTMRLDELNVEDVGFIKIDVEGFEYAVLEGARALLERDHPTLLIEIEQAHSVKPIEEVFSWLQRLGYSGYFFRGGRLQSLSLFDVKRDQAIENKTRLGAIRRSYVNNFIFAKGTPEFFVR